MILGLLQARMASSRLPGKILMPILGKPMLLHQIERLSKVTLMDKLIVATSDESSDDAAAEMCQQYGIDCFRGSHHDVLDRFYQAAKSFSPQHIVRLTGDCPLADAKIIDAVIQFHVEGNYDYSSNALKSTFPDGLDVEVVRFSCLEEAWLKATLPSHREHVMPYVHRQPDKFKLGSFESKEDFSSHRWTVDELKDFELVSKIYEGLYSANPQFDYADILELLGKNPELIKINAHYERNEGMKKSLREDAEYMERYQNNVG